MSRDVMAQQMKSKNTYACRAATLSILRLWIFNYSLFHEAFMSSATSAGSKTLLYRRLRVRVIFVILRLTVLKIPLEAAATSSIALGGKFWHGCVPRGLFCMP